MLLLALSAALGFEFLEGSNLLLEECGWSACAQAQATNLTQCSTVTNEAEYCSCVKTEARMQTHIESDECMVLVDCLIDAACADLTTYHTQAALTIYNGTSCSEVACSSVLSPADGTCHRLHVAAGTPVMGVWARASCDTDPASYIPYLKVVFYSSRANCEQNLSGRSIYFDTIKDAGVCIQLPDFPGFSWVMHTGACYHPKEASRLEPGVGLTGQLLPSHSAWLPWLPEGTVTLANGGLQFPSDPPGNCAKVCDKIQQCDGWQVVNTSGVPLCTLFTSTTVGLDINGATAGRSIQKYEAVCVRWEATPSSAMLFNLKSSWCSEACSSNPTIEHCAGKPSLPVTTVNAYDSCDNKKIIYSVEMTADSLCHEYQALNPENRLPFWAAVRCQGSGVYIAVYSTYETCTMAGNATTPHPNSFALESSMCTSNVVHGQALGWEMLSSCYTPPVKKACRCAAVTVPERPHKQCATYHGQLKGEVIIPESSWWSEVPGYISKDMWWTIQRPGLPSICGCKNKNTLSSKQYTGRLCQDTLTMECSTPERQYICNEQNTILCEVTDMDIDSNVVNLCESLCLGVPGCAGFNADISGGRCKLLASLQGLDTTVVYASGDCQRGPDQECALWHKTPGNYLVDNDCKLPPSTQCSMSACHRVVTLSGNIFPTVTHCSNSCSCIINTLKNVIPARIPECGDYLSCLNSTQCSEWLNRPTPPANCTCMSTNIVTGRDFNTTQCCARGRCGKCEAWHSRGYCTLSPDSCLQCGGTVCEDLNPVFVGNLCSCKRYVLTDTTVRDTSSSKVCALGDGFGTCYNVDSEGNCPSGSRLCDQCECKENCPHAECTAFPGFLSELGSTAESCDCTVYASSLTHSSDVLCLNQFSPKTCIPAFKNNTCPPGGWMACMGRKPNKMIQVMWQEWTVELMLVHDDPVNHIVLIFICPMEACPYDMCPTTVEKRNSLGCVDIPRERKTNATRPVLGKAVMCGYLWVTTEEALGRYGALTTNSTVDLEIVARFSVVDAVEYSWTTPEDSLVPSPPSKGNGGSGHVDSNCEEFCTYLALLLPVFVLSIIGGIFYHRWAGQTVWWVHEQQPSEPDDDIYHPNVHTHVSDDMNESSARHDLPSVAPPPPLPPAESAPDYSPSSEQPPPSPTIHMQYDPTNPNIATEAFPS